MSRLPDLKIKRAIVHRIIPKEELTEHATIESTENVVDLSAEVEEMVIRRINSAIRNQHRTFALDFDRTDEHSFFGVAQLVGDSNNKEFAAHSIMLAQSMARAQKSSSIPGGYFILLDTTYGEASTPAIIAIKAEPHEALRHTVDDSGKSRVDLLKSVFLSPSQKLFKLGILFEREEVFGDEINDIFGCILYDAQFRVDSDPAEYFYKDFLGLTTESNARIQSKRFYEKTKEFAQSVDPTTELAADLDDALRLELANSDVQHVTPAFFAEQHIQSEDLRAEYVRQVVDFMPETFQKDPSLVQQQLKTRKIEFENKVSLSGPEEAFNRSVKILEQSEEHIVIRISARRKA